MVKKDKIKLYGNRVKEVLDQKQMVAQELADRVPTTAGHISVIINGQSTHISLPIAMRIAEILEKPVEYLFILDTRE